MKFFKGFGNLLASKAGSAPWYKIRNYFNHSYITIFSNIKVDYYGEALKKTKEKA